MQETPNTPILTKRRLTKEEREAHVETWKKSGLTMTDYCRQNNLPLANLSEWKQSTLKKDRLFKSIQTPSVPTTASKPENIVEILVDQRIKIRLQHVTDASLVINIAKGMLTCS